jgi:dihydropteroate synthase
MGILNVTPDSFSDGGRFTDIARAIEHGLTMEREGAAIIDVGGESTRPGAEPVSQRDELARVVPVIKGLRGAGLKATISIDTSKAPVAAAALDAGADLVNDVSALRADPGMAELVAAREVPCVLMHMRGEPRTMQRDPRYADVVGEVRTFLEQRLRAALDAGIAEDRVWLDPGIGFGKTVEHNLALLRGLPTLAALGRPLVIGTSRKSFLGKLTGRDAGGLATATAATSVLAYERGARVFRVHDVAATLDALIVAAATVAG